MFETAELGRSIPKTFYKKQEPILRQELLSVQEDLRKHDQSQVVLVFAGVDGAGKGETVNLLNEWMDPRWLITRAFDEPTQAERERPPFWRYWLALPPRGRIGMFLSSWYSEPVLRRVRGEISESEFDTALDRIVTFETELADDGAVFLKFWMHLSHDAQKKRLESLEADPLTKARITDQDWDNWRNYDSFISAAERVIMRTHTGKAPWTIVEGEDANYRGLTVGTLVRDTLIHRLDEIKLEERVRSEIAERMGEDSHSRSGKSKKHKGSKKSDCDGRAGDSASSEHLASASDLRSVINVLSHLDMTQKISKSEYNSRLRECQGRLHLQHHRAKELGISTILLFEGPDAAGKGGAIRRINAALDARNYQVHGVAAPTDEERAQHYLWRFWRHLSRAGRFTVFDRSWYGRVLVERIEGFAREEEWRRAYNEINDFEAQLTEHGLVLLKYWIHISNEEQLARFKLREQTPYKRWKLTDEDWRNREKWGEYELAVHDMVQYTSSHLAPWILVEGNDKRFARVKVLETLSEHLGKAIEAKETPVRTPDGTTPPLITRSEELAEEGRLK